MRPVSDEPITAEYVIARLEEAGATLLAMSLPRVSPRPLGSQFQHFPVVRDAAEAYGWTGASVRAAFPEAAAISRMDEAMAWIELIPTGHYVLRRIVGARALVAPVTGRRLFRWSRIAALLHADPRAVKRWHADGIRMIVAALREREQARAA